MMLQQPIPSGAQSVEWHYVAFVTVRIAPRKLSYFILCVKNNDLFVAADRQGLCCQICARGLSCPTYTEWLHKNEKPAEHEKCVKKFWKSLSIVKQQQQQQQPSDVRRCSYSSCKRNGNTEWPASGFSNVPSNGSKINAALPTVYRPTSGWAAYDRLGRWLGSSRDLAQDALTL